jgi:hypothetical protein
MAEALRASFLPKKEGKMKSGKTGVPVRVSNGEHMFTPKEKKKIDEALVAKGMNPNAVWATMIPNPDPGNELSNGGAVSDTTMVKPAIQMALNPATKVMSDKDKKDAMDIMWKKRTSLPVSQQPVLLAEGGETKKVLSGVKEKKPTILSYDKKKFRDKIKKAIEEAEAEKDPALRLQKLQALNEMNSKNLLNSDEGNYVAQLISSSNLDLLKKKSFASKPIGPSNVAIGVDKMIKSQQKESADYKKQQPLLRSKLESRKKEISSTLASIKQDPSLFNKDQFEKLNNELKEIDDLLKSNVTTFASWNTKAANVLKIKPERLNTELGIKTPDIVKPKSSSNKEFSGDKYEQMLRKDPRFANLSDDQIKQAVANARAKFNEQKQSEIPTVTMPAPAAPTTGGRSKAGTSKTGASPSTANDDPAEQAPPEETPAEQQASAIQGALTGATAGAEPAPEAEKEPKLSPIQIMSLAQITAGLMSANQERPMDTPSPVFISRVAASIGAAEKATNEAEYGFTYTQRQNIEKNLEKNRRQAMATTLQTTSGASGVSQALRALSQDKNAAAIEVEAKDAEVKAMKQNRADGVNQQADAMATALDQRKRQIFENDSKAYWLGAEASGAMIDAGLSNLFNSIEQRKIDNEREKRNN